MSQNLKTFLHDDANIGYSQGELSVWLAEVVPGRSIGDRYVVTAELVASNSFVIEMDDGSQFKMTCEKLS